MSLDLDAVRLTVRPNDLTPEVWSRDNAVQTGGLLFLPEARCALHGGRAELLAGWAGFAAPRVG